MKSHQVAAIVVGLVILVVSSLPVILAYNKYDLETLGDYRLIHVFIYPTVGVVVAGVIVFLAFFKDRNKEV